MDAKILAKILALRLNKVTSSLINLDQANFIQGLPFTTIQILSNGPYSRVIVSLDTQKAFDYIIFGP